MVELEETFCDSAQSIHLKMFFLFFPLHMCELLPLSGRSLSGGVCMLVCLFM